MDLGLNEKAALVLGAGGGLGGAIAAALAAEGAMVALADINLNAAEKNAREIVAGGGRAIAVEWDLGQIDQINPKVTEVNERLGQIDILVNNTGGPRPGPIVGEDADLWARCFDSMVLSVIKLTDAVLPGMRVRKWGRVITSTSSGVIAPIPNLGLSNTLRASLVGWSKTLAREVGRDGITSNIILPGRIATPRITYLDEQKAKREGRDVSDVSAESIASIPVGRYGDPKEYGDMVAFLASPRASYITGSTIRVDGGLLANI